jgi:hypothetical protein
MRKRFALGGVLVAVVAAVGLAIATTGSAQLSTPRSVAFVLHFKGQTNKTRHFKPGAAITSRSAVFNGTDTTRVGRSSELCTETVAKPTTFQCDISLLVNDGELTVNGALNPTRTPWSAPVAGGSGAYNGAGGTLTVTSMHGRKELWSFALTG